MKAIVAVNKDWGIGVNGGLLCHLSGDLSHFKKLTTDGIVVMGSKTWDSLPKKPLPNRTNIIITRNPDKYPEFKKLPESKLEELEMGETYVGTMFTILQLQFSKYSDKTWILGGGEIYTSCIGSCDTVELTWIYDAPDADTFIPNLYSLGFVQEYASDTIEENGYHYCYMVLKRKQGMPTTIGNDNK